MENKEGSPQPIQHSRRGYKRTFVFLDKMETKAPSAKRLERLKKDGRVAEITFTRNHSASDIGRLLLAHFPLLFGMDLKRYVSLLMRVRATASSAPA